MISLNIFKSNLCANESNVIPTGPSIEFSNVAIPVPVDCTEFGQTLKIKIKNEKMKKKKDTNITKNIYKRNKIKK